MANQAAWQKTFKGHPFTIEESPMPVPKPHQIIIKTRAIGINPADAAVQRLGMVYDESKHPLILGFDVAGEVHALGDDVKRFKVGDRVLANSVDITPEHYESARGCFQLYCAANAALTAHLPENVTFSEAAVFPSCLCVAGYALFLPTTLAMSLPPATGTAEPNGKTVIVWGGSSVVGSCAIQLAKLAGYSVIATSSELNFSHCLSLGAENVFDYKSSHVVEDIVAACKGRHVVGAFVAYYNNDSTVACADIVSQVSGDKVVATVAPPHFPPPEVSDKTVNIVASKFPKLQASTSFNTTNAPLTQQPADWAPAFGDTREGAYTLSEWLTPALAEGRFQLSPRPEVLGQGLEALQGAVDTMFERLHTLGPNAAQAKEKSITPRKIVVEIG
ncbi:hypothetical protein Q7P37_008222 [Cladosporium fusiforme]